MKPREILDELDRLGIRVWWREVGAQGRHSRTPKIRVQEGAPGAVRGHQGTQRRAAKDHGPSQGWGAWHLLQRSQATALNLTCRDRCQNGRQRERQVSRGVVFAGAQGSYSVEVATGARVELEAHGRRLHIYTRDAALRLGRAGYQL